MAKPIIDNDPDKIKLLEERIQQLLAREEKKDGGYAGMLVNCVVREAAKFFSRCPDDFCWAAGDWHEGHLVFGSTNRLHWSVAGGFWPSREHCTPRFLYQFEGEVWEPIGYLDESHNTAWPHIILTASAGEGQIDVPVTYPNSHHAILGRKDKRGSGKIAEVRFYTGVEA